MPMPFVSTISQEASILSKQSSNLDNYRLLYSIKETDPNGEKFLITFVGPKILAFENYRFYLLKNSVTKPLQPNFFYRPDYLSYNEYSTINWWALLMYINDVPTLEDFTIPNVLVPSGASLLQMSRDLSANNLITQIVPLYNSTPPPTPPLFSRVSNDPTIPVSSTPSLQLSHPNLLSPYKENFVVDVVMARQRYIDLKFEPQKESIVLTINRNSNYFHGRHYSMIRPNRLTWDARKLSNGSGLTSVLVEGTKFEVSYNRKEK